jgi:hypothetical protein
VFGKWISTQRRRERRGSAEKRIGVAEFPFQEAPDLGEEGVEADESFHAGAEITLGLSVGGLVAGGEGQQADAAQGAGGWPRENSCFPGYPCSIEIA